MEQDYQASAPFEGPEKLLELWFAPSAADVPPLDAATHARPGLMTVTQQTWEDMLAIVQCKVLSVIRGTEMDAYLLSESSFFVFPHRLILKTCGTTLNLLGLPRILEIAASQANLPCVYRCFYSRKSFMFPERQTGPHRDWKQEVEYLDNIFPNGAAYSIGKVNGDHWLLYITGANALPNDSFHPAYVETGDRRVDYTIEILMSKLSHKARQPFFFSDPLQSGPQESPCSQAAVLSEKLGITNIFPPSLTNLDSYAFQPCGYSSNALIQWGHESLDHDCDHPAPAERQDHPGEGYYTIHVTPEEGWSYASFECNVPLSTSEISDKNKIPDLKSLIKRVVNIFEPGRLTLTLFISSEDNETGEESAVESAQRAFKAALAEISPLRPEISDGSALTYRRTDKINYEFGGYDLAFATFELK